MTNGGLITKLFPNTRHAVASYHWDSTKISLIRAIFTSNFICTDYGTYLHETVPIFVEGIASPPQVAIVIFVCCCCCQLPFLIRLSITVNSELEEKNKTRHESFRHHYRVIHAADHIDLYSIALHNRVCSPNGYTATTTWPAVMTAKKWWAWRTLYVVNLSWNGIDIDQWELTKHLDPGLGHLGWKWI